MKIPKRSIGLRALLVIAGLGLFVLLPLAWFAPTVAALTLAAAAVVEAFLVQRRASALAESHEKLSGEIDVLSQHLLKVEALASAAAARQRPAASGPVATPAADASALASSVEEVTAEIGLLSGIVRELAAVVSAQDAEISQLKTKPQAAEPSARPQTVAAPPTDLLSPAVVVVDRAAPPTRPLSLPKQAPAAPIPKAPAASIPKAPTLPRDPGHESAIIDAFDGAGLEVWLQPVVTLPQRKVVSYEALARLRLGSGETAPVLSPESFMPVLERHGRTTALDRRVLKNAATIARHLQGRGSPAVVAYGLSPLSVYEPDFLRSLGGLIETGTELNGRLSVALPQESWRGLDAEQKAVLAALRGRIGFVLDRPTDLRFEAAALAALGIGQVKVPVALLLRPAAEAQPDIAVEDLVAALGRSGIRLAVCDVAQETDVPDLIDLDVPLAQGPVFAAARAVRTEVLSTPQATAEPAVQPNPEPPPQRRGFRDFLRRAV